MKHWVVLFCLAVTCVGQAGCSYNNSRLHSKLSDKRMGSVLASKFQGAQDAEDQAQRALELLDSDQFALVVYHQEAGTDLFFHIAKPGFSFFLPKSPDTGVHVRFDEAYQYVGHDRSKPDALVLLLPWAQGELVVRDQQGNKEKYVVISRNSHAKRKEQD